MPVPCSKNEFLSIPQIFNLLRQAGYEENLIVPFTALVLYESNGCNKAYRIIGENSHCLLQMNLNAHGTKYGTASQLTSNPLFCLQQAYKLYKIQGFNAWKNSYNKYLSNYEEIAAKVKAAYNGNNSNTNTTNAIINAVNPSYDTKAHTGLNASNNSNKNTYYAIGAFLFLILISR